MLLLDSNELISAGVNTDICVYKLNELGSLGDQYGRASEQQKTVAKLRHIPPFPQRSPVKYADGMVLMLNAN